MIQGILDSSECEAEIKVFTKLLQLSIVSNQGDFIKTEAVMPYRVFSDARRMLAKYNCAEAQFLLHVLKRKSDAALQRVTALSNVEESFLYFSQLKDLYPNEYFMAGNNLVALLLQSKGIGVQPSRKNETELFREPFRLAQFLLGELPKRAPIPLYMYLKNNELIAKRFYTDVPFEDKELQTFESQINKLDHDSQIMFHMNLGTHYAYMGQYKEARQSWNIAEGLNGDGDDFFAYIIESNRLVCELCEGRKPEFLQLATPALMSEPEIMQYVTLRNELIQELISKESIKNYQSIEAAFANKFESAFAKANLVFYSKPFLFSDVQFWSDN